MVTPDDIAEELGQEPPESGSATQVQWQRWIDRAYRAIERRAERLGVPYASLNEGDVDEVVTYAVLRRRSRPTDGAVSVTEQGSVDDASMLDTRRYPEFQGDVFFLSSWWDLLGLGDGAGAGWAGSLPYVR